MNRLNSKVILIALLFSSGAFSESDNSCGLYHQLHLHMNIEQVKKIVGTQYPIGVKGKTYVWELAGKAPTNLAFSDDGIFMSATGSIPDQITLLINNKTLNLTQAQQILGAGTVSGKIYSVNLPNDKSINISTDLNDQVNAIEGNIYCP